MLEEFRDIPGWVGIYKVSNLGNVVSLDRRVNNRKIHGRKIKPGKASGYLKVNLCSGYRSISTTFTIGHLVLTAFVGTRPDGMMAQHRDGNGENNSLTNLFWGINNPRRCK